MIDLYVYYKVRTLDAAALAPRVRAMQAALAGQASSAPLSAQFSAQLKCRPESKDGLQTWMEVYPGVPDTFAGVLEQAASAAGLDTLIQGPRRAEVFVDLVPEPTPEQTPCA